MVVMEAQEILFSLAAVAVALAQLEEMVPFHLLEAMVVMELHLQY
jgi:hypothetical protein